MECKTSPAARRLRAGFTLAEFTIASGIVGVLMVALMSFSIFSGRSLLAMGNYIDLDSQSRRALDNLTKEVRRSQTVKAYTTNSITLTDYDADDLMYTYSPSARTLTRTKQNTTTTVLENCDSLTFNMLARDPVSSSWDLTATTNLTQCKALWVYWKCSRTFIAPQVNASTMTSANIVLRVK